MPTRNSLLPAASGLLVQVSRNTLQSPEGILIVVVSEQDPSQATAGVVDLNGMAFLHTPPGNWRLFPLNFKIRRR